MQSIKTHVVPAKAAQRPRAGTHAPQRTEKARRMGPRLRGDDRWLRAGLWFLALALIAPATASADPVADFYHGKTINLFVSFPPGGGYDIYARVLVPYFSRHIPGNPAIVIKNMEGGSGVKAAGYITTITPQDGTSLGLFLDTLTLGKVLGGPGEFDPVKLVWVGRIVSTATLAMVWHTSAVQSVEEAKQKQIIIAASVPSNSSSFIPTALNDLIGTKFKIVRGFPGSPPMALAMERGEVDALGGMSWEAIQLTKPDWLSEKKARGLYTHGAHHLKDLPDVPGLVDLAIDDKSRRILGLMGGGPDIGRSIVAEPGIPSERAAALRKAFMDTMEDGEFVADMHKRNLGVEPLPGEEVQKIVANAAATPKELVEQASHYAGQ
jgi:tripartite-type tricarboxylate transporter receptor subunit TctC